MVSPIPLVKHSYLYGASTAREEALLNAQNSQERQTSMNKLHAGGSKGGQIVVPQIYTGASSDTQLNEHISQINHTFMKHQENSKFDELALSNKKGGRKINSGRKSTKHLRKLKRTTKHLRKLKRTTKHFKKTKKH